MHSKITVLLSLLVFSGCSNGDDLRRTLRHDLKDIPLADDLGIIRSIHVLTVDGVESLYNPSLVSLSDGKYLTVFGFGASKKLQTSADTHIGVAELDSNFRQIGVTQILNINESVIHDPRVVRIGGKLYVPYSATTSGDRRMHIALISRDSNNTWNVDSNHFVDFSLQSEEKNWAPFDYQGRFMLSHSYEPHRVFEYDPSRPNTVNPVAESAGASWNFGDIRGGTPALLENGDYLTFFHSHTKNESGTVTYFMGALVFDSKPPFKIKKKSQFPLIYRDLYSSLHSEQTVGFGKINWFVAFPAGIVVEENRILVSYGENDSAGKVVELDKAKFLATLVDVN